MHLLRKKNEQGQRDDDDDDWRATVEVSEDFYVLLIFIAFRLNWYRISNYRVAACS